jgi:hypothetical protein
MRTLTRALAFMAVAACACSTGGEAADRDSSSADGDVTAADADMPGDETGSESLPDTTPDGTGADADVVPDTVADPGADPSPDPAQDAPADLPAETCTTCDATEATDLVTEAGPCANGTFAVTALSLAGKDFAVDAAAGATVSVVASWTLSNPPSCAACSRQVVLGVEDAVMGCMVAGKPKTCPSESEGTGISSVTAPDEPGTYNVYAAAPLADDCAAAKVAYGEGAAREVVGVLHVAPGCALPDCPATACEPAECGAIGKACGTWGDGCRHDLDCGACAEGTECGLDGACAGPCANGWLRPVGVHAAGSGKLASAKAGQQIGVAFDLEIGDPASCEGCGRQVLVGFDSAAWCQDVGVVPTCPEFAKVAISGALAVPSVAGTHVLYAVAPAAADCDAAEDAFLDEDVARVAVATVMVHAACEPGTCEGSGRVCGPFADGCGFDLECGECAAGQSCSVAGTCACSADDAYEPNDTPGKAYDLGTSTDSDVASHQSLAASMENEADWFVMHAQDQPITVMDPFVAVATPAGKPYHVSVAYVCADGSSPVYKPHDDSTCAGGGKVDLTTVPGLGQVTGYSCDSQGATVIVHFEPTCSGTIDDSGRLFVGVSSTGYCTSYTVDLHL